MSTDESEDRGDSYENIWLSISATFVLYGAQGLAMWIMFECLRRREEMVYAPRLELKPNRVPPAISSWPLLWISSVVAVPDDEVIRIAGMVGTARTLYCLLTY
jgi:hypothetical protein